MIVNCPTEGCGNQGVAIDVPTVDGVAPTVVCGVCGTQLHAGDTP